MPPDSVPVCMGVCDGRKAVGARAPVACTSSFRMPGFNAWLVWGVGPLAVVPTRRPMMWWSSRRMLVSTPASWAPWWVCAVGARSTTLEPSSTTCAVTGARAGMWRGPVPAEAPPPTLARRDDCRALTASACSRHGSVLLWVRRTFTPLMCPSTKCTPVSSASVGGTMESASLRNSPLMALARLARSRFWARV